MSGKKVEVKVPDGYELIQDGLQIKFVEQSGKWDSKDKISGYYVNKDSKIVGCVPFPRVERHSNIFYKESQAVGSLALSRLSQQLADFNDGWEPDWYNQEEYKSCIYHEFNSDGDEFKIVRLRNFRNLYSFLTFKTDKDAELFLDENIREILLAKDFI